MVMLMVGGSLSTVVTTHNVAHRCRQGAVHPISTVGASRSSSASSRPCTRSAPSPIISACSTSRRGAATTATSISTGHHPNTATTLNASCMPITSSSRPVSRARDCCSISPSHIPGSSGPPSHHGCAPSDPGSRPPNSSSQPRYASGSLNFSWIPRTTTSSRNSSPNERIPIKCRASNSQLERKFWANPRLSSYLPSVETWVVRHYFLVSRPARLCPDKSPAVTL